MSPEDHDTGEIEHVGGWYFIKVPTVNKDYVIWCDENCLESDWLQLGRVFYFKSREQLTAFRLTWSL